MGRQFDATDLADSAIDNGASIDAFRAQILARMKDTGKLRPAESAEIGMSEAETKQFSFCRALLAAGDPLHAAQLAPFEMECSRAAQDKRGDSRDKMREAALTIPVDMLSRGLAMDNGVATLVAKRMIAKAARSSVEAQAMYRDLVAGTTTGRESTTKVV